MMLTTTAYQSWEATYDQATSPSNMYLATAGDTLSAAHFHDLDGFDDVDMVGMEVDLTGLLPSMAEEAPVVATPVQAAPAPFTPAHVVTASVVPAPPLPLPALPAMPPTTAEAHDPASQTEEIRDSEFEVMYDHLEEAAVMELLEDFKDSPELQHAFYAAPAQYTGYTPTVAEETYHWNLCATPHMMAGLAAHMHSPQAIAVG